MAPYGSFNEDAMEVWDFARCQRKDGSTYGTDGTCRKGTEIETEKETSKEGKYMPRKPEGETGVTSEFQVSLVPRTPFEPEKIQKELDKIKSGKKVKQYGKPVTEEELEKRLKQTEKNVEFVKTLESNLPKDYEMTVYGGGLVGINKTTRSGDKVSITFGSRKVSFTVNGQMDAGGVTDRNAQMEVASTVRKTYDAIVKSLPVGTIITTEAYADDGKGAARQRVYERIGFSKAKPGETIYAVKLKDGSMAPPKSKDPLEDLKNQYKDENSFWFSEKEGKVADLLWHVAIFGARQVYKTKQRV
jgi:hypothetical protein